MLKLKLQTYLLLTFILLTVVTLIYINYQSVKSDVLESVQLETNELLNDFINEINRFSNERIVEIELIADYIATIESEEEIVQFLANQRDKMPIIIDLGIISVNGELTVSNGSRVNVPHKESFKRALNGETVFSDTFSSFQDPKLRINVIRTPILKNGKTIGVLSVAINMKEVLGDFGANSNLQGSLFLLKGDQLVFSSSKNELKDIVPNSSRALQEIYEHDQGSILIDENSAHYVMYQRGDDEWKVVVDSFTKKVEDQIFSIFWWNVLMIVMTVLILGSILFYLWKNEQRKEMMLKRDLLTNLPNRVMLEEHLTKQMGPQNFKVFTMFFINMDRFKEINERTGYLIGDRLLFETSRKIQSIIGKYDLYRVGGDEFVIIVPSHDKEVLRKLAVDLIKLMEEPIELSEFESVWLTLSVGIRKSELEDWPELMMQDAMFAVQEAKKQGGNRFVFFSKELATQNDRVRQIANNVGHALARNEYFLMYQPVYHVSTKKIVSYEALLRWGSPVIGHISPVEFIPLLEKNDLIIPVGRWILRQVTSQMKIWEEGGHSDFQVAVNISVKQMMHPDFLEDVKSIISESEIPPHRLIFEITETVAVQNSKLATQVLSELNELGVKTALDDFGTGYSSLSILKLLPIQQVKVDRSFIVEMEQDGEKSQVILEGVLEIAKNLGLSTVVEGVETQKQLALLKKMDVQKIQGFLISRPVMAKDAIELRKQSWNH